jgi:hypothetical protein
MGHELNALDWPSGLDCLWQILQNDAAWEVGKFGPQSSALVPNATPDVNEMCTLRLERRHFFCEGCNIEPVTFAGNTHQLLKPSEFFGILGSLGKEAELSVKSLVPCVSAASVALILGFLEVVRESLVSWPANIETIIFSAIEIWYSSLLTYV